MSTAIISILADISQDITKYGGSIVFLAGIIGGLLNITIFFTLRTFRENSSGFYLIVMSFANIGCLMTGLFSRILISGFNIDWTLTSSFFCKFRWYTIQLFILTSFTCTCLVAIDQYMATCTRLRWRQWSNIKTAYYLITIFIVTWLLHGLVYLVGFNLILSPTTNKIICNGITLIYQGYHIYGYLITLAGVLPLVITSIFGLLASNNIRHLAHRTVPLVQRELDKQLTTMILNQLLYNFIFTSPFTILTVLTSFLPTIKNPTIAASISFINVMFILLYYFSFACPFYIYIVACDRYRQQLIYVFSHLYFRRRRQLRIGINQVIPDV